MNPDSESLVVVTTITDPNMAQVMRVALESEGIPCQVEGGGQAGFAGVLPIHLLINKEDMDRAREVLDIQSDRAMIERIRETASGAL